MFAEVICDYVSSGLVLVWVCVAGWPKIIHIEIMFEED